MVNQDESCRAELVVLLDIIWCLGERYSTKDWVQKSGLSITTINRLFYGAFVWPRFETIQKLASAVDLSLTFDKAGLSVSIESRLSRK